NVLSTPRTLEVVAKEQRLSPAALDAHLQQLKARLLAARAQRPAPLRDEKVIVAWNGLTLSALARAALVTGDMRYGEAAERAARVLLSTQRANRYLPHLFIAGLAQGHGFADDHALLAAGLLDLFELTADTAWLTDAITLMERLERSFADEANGGYFLSASTH